MLIEYLAAREAGYSLKEWHDLSLKERFRAKYFYQAKNILKEREYKKHEAQVKRGR